MESRRTTNGLREPNFFLMNGKATPLKASHYLDLSQQQLFRLTNHRKIPCSKYSGRFIIFWEDASAFRQSSMTTPLNNHVSVFADATTDRLLNDEDIEPP